MYDSHLMTMHQLSNILFNCSQGSYTMDDVLDSIKGMLLDYNKISAKSVNITDFRKKKDKVNVQKTNG